MPLSLAGSLGTGDTPSRTEGQWHGRAGGTGVQLCPSCQGWEPQAQPVQPQGINPKGSAAVIPKEAPGAGQGFRAEPALSWGWNFALEMMSSALDFEKSERFPCPGCAEHQLGPESSWALSPSPLPQPCPNIRQLSSSQLNWEEIITTLRYECCLSNLWC